MLKNEQDNKLNSEKSSISSLQNGTFSKLICGASNTNAKQVERLSIIYSLAGIDVIDISPNLEIFQAAQHGLDLAKELYNDSSQNYPHFNLPDIMISVNAGLDKHFRKACFDTIKCSKCNKCIEVCPSSAVSIENFELHFNINSCFGCGRCLKVCDFEVIQLIDNDTFQIKDFIDNQIEISAIEIHTGNNSIEYIKSFVRDNFKIINAAELVSFSIESNFFSPVEVIEYASSIIKLIDKKIIIQIDGSPMSANNKSFSGIQSITYANILADAKLDAYIQVAGGANHLTKKYLDLFNIEINGIGYGTFARKIILSYIDSLNEIDFNNNLKKAINIATSLVKKSDLKKII